MQIHETGLVLVISYYFNILNLFISPKIFCLFIFFYYTVPSYHKMPQLNRVDQFHKCMYETESLAVYCVVRTAIKPDASSEYWQQIERFSNDTKRHYRHDILTTGLCLTRCEAELKTLNASFRETLHAENDFLVNYKVRRHVTSKTSFQSGFNIMWVKKGH